MNRTYKIREDLTLKYKGITLYRIEALVDIPSAEVVAGDIGGYVESYDNLKDTAWVFDDAKVYDNAQVYDNARVYGKAEICYDAEVHDDADYIVFKNWWSSGRYFTWTRSNNMWKVGCFHGTGEELVKKAYKDSKISGDNYKAIVDYVNNVVIPQQSQKSDKGADLFDAYAIYYNCSREEAKSRVFAEVAKYSKYLK